MNEPSVTAIFPIRVAPAGGIVSWDEGRELELDVRNEVWSVYISKCLMWNELFYHFIFVDSNQWSANY